MCVSSCTLLLLVPWLILEIPLSETNTMKWIVIIYISPLWIFFPSLFGKHEERVGWWVTLVSCNPTYPTLLDTTGLKKLFCQKKVLTIKRGIWKQWLFCVCQQNVFSKKMTDYWRVSTGVWWRKHHFLRIYDLSLRIRPDIGLHEAVVMWLFSYCIKRFQKCALSRI